MPNNEIYDQQSSDTTNVIVTKKPYRNSVVISTMTSTLGSTKTKSITKPEVVKKDVIKKPSKQNSDDWTVYNFLKSIVKLG